MLYIMIGLGNKSYSGAFKRIFIYLTVLSFTASISAYVYHNQPYYLSFYSARFALYFGLYSFLHQYKFDPDYVLKVIMFFGLVWATIMVVQSFTFPKMLFAEKLLETYEYLERARGTIIRVNLKDVRFGVLALVVLVNRYSTSRALNLYSGFLLVFLISAIIRTGTRQIIFSCFVLSVLLYFNADRRKKSSRYAWFGLIVLPMSFALAYLVTINLGSLELLASSLKDDLTSSNIRYLAGVFYLFEYWPSYSPYVAYILGNGIEHGQSEYGREIIDKHWQTLHFYREDVGIIGAYSKFGLLYVISYFTLFYRLIKMKSLPQNLYIRYFIIFLLITSLTGRNHLENPPVIVIVVCLAYILDKFNNPSDRIESIKS